ncbi:thioredoxin family protein [Pseudomonas sp. ABY48]|uniref:thioredoxin family protein n=1 Tax=Pseudomonas sp. ABY48 TaxID=3402865 RepID=UPI003B435CB3
MTLTTVTASDFEEQVLKSTSPVIVLFSTRGKKSSDNMVNSLEEAVKAHGAQISFLEKAFDQEGSIEKKKTYDVQSAPTTLFFKGGKLERTVVGFYKFEGVFKTWVEELSQA